ncbi:MAG: pseudouridine synthase [Anaerolineae bacterium]|nr:pseudouridine synthase [Anaerolineae bacterium]
MTPKKPERLQKVMAHAGVASRRASEQMILAGRVRVNGRVTTELGVKVNPEEDEITVDGKRLEAAKETPVYILLNKPYGILSAASDDRGRKTVVDLVDVSERIYPVGRLDLKSEGLILLTNDGTLSERLTHPRYHLEKEYEVQVIGKPSEQKLAQWRSGEVILDGKPIAPATVERIKVEKENQWLRVVMTEGRKRQIRRVAEALGHRVRRLERVRIGPLKLGRLKSGNWRHLSKWELQQLNQQLQLPPAKKSHHKR